VEPRRQLVAGRAGAVLCVAIDNIDGNIINYRAAFIWQPKPWLGFGAGYDSFGIDVDVDKERMKGSLEWTYSGPQVFFNFAF
jgi:hypothetical protein